MVSLDLPSFPRHHRLSMPNAHRLSMPNAPFPRHTPQAIQLTYKSASVEVSICIRPLPPASPSSLGRAEEWAVRRERLRRPPPRAPPSQRHPPRAHSAPPSSSSSSSASTCILVPYTDEFHRVATFTSSFTSLYHDTTLAGVAVHDDRLRRHALLQENRLERRRTKCVQMQSLAVRYQNRAEHLRHQLREERQRQYTSLISAVRRLQAVFRLQQYLKRKRVEEIRMANEAAVVMQDFGKRAMAMLNAKKELARMKYEIRCKAAGAVIATWWKSRWQILQAKRLRQALLAARQRREALARLKGALFGQSHFRRRRDRRWVAAMRRRRMQEEAAVAAAAAAAAAAWDEELEGRRRRRRELHDRPFR